MKVAIVHDDLVQWGGAERVLLAISEVFPEAPIYTLFYDKSNPVLSSKFQDKKIIPSFLQKIPSWESFYKALLPLHPIAFEQFDFSDYDLVISQTTRFAKSIITKPKTKHICYCHTPPRFLWNFSGEKVNGILSPYLSKLKIYDHITSKRVDYFLAGSKNAQKRIERVYQSKSKVLYPFVDLEQFKLENSFDGDYFLIIARLNDYKRVDLAVRVFNELPKLNLKIVGVGPKLGELKEIAKSNIDFLEAVSEKTLVNLLSGCQGLIVTAEEDFGLTPLEAQACGKPVLAFGQGGALETVVDGKTGILFNEQTKDSLKQALEKFIKTKFKVEDCVKNAQSFSKEKFKENLLNIIKELS